MQLARDSEAARVDLRAATPDLWPRRATIVLSLIGVASMAATSLLQTGVVRHLPDLPLPGFDSDKVNLSTTAYPFGISDGTVGLLSFAANLPLAAFGGPDRARVRPWVVMLAAPKALADGVVSGWYFYQMPTKEKAWCAYCIVAQLASLGILAATLPEARRALAELRRV
ncbi:MAG: vitamin K epoxide reductase family protein [Chloroflexota bacterium]|nr:vitamin K epoxide reductase family protein [Chloroflexota bacterium]